VSKRAVDFPLAHRQLQLAADRNVLEVAQRWPTEGQAFEGGNRVLWGWELTTRLQYPHLTEVHFHLRPGKLRLPEVASFVGQRAE